MTSSGTALNHRAWLAGDTGRCDCREQPTASRAGGSPAPTAFPPRDAVLLQLRKMGRSAYWKAEADSLASLPLGDANRGAFLALQSAVSTRRRLVATDPPERRASSCFSLS
jgi:hypothetical protein